jgi:hypothetical protein
MCKALAVDDHFDTLEGKAKAALTKLYGGANLTGYEYLDPHGDPLDEGDKAATMADLFYSTPEGGMCVTVWATDYDGDIHYSAEW